MLVQAVSFEEDDARRLKVSRLTCKPYGGGGNHRGLAVLHRVSSAHVFCRYSRGSIRGLSI